jgi:hypothetical protein
MVLWFLSLFGEPKFSLYLRGDGVKYWNNPIIIMERVRCWEPARVYLFLFLNTDSLLGKRDGWRCSCPH